MVVAACFTVAMDGRHCLLPSQMMKPAQVAEGTEGKTMMKSVSQSFWGKADFEKTQVANLHIS